MADPFSLSRANRSAQPARPMAKPSVFDRIVGRGNYMKEFAARRGEIIKEFRVEKRRTHKQLKRENEKYLDKLEEGNIEAYQRFNVRMSNRWTDGGLDEEKQERLKRKEMRKINKKLRRNEREAVRDLLRQRDLRIRDMGDSLLEQTTLVSEPPQVINVEQVQGGQQRRAA